MSTTRFHPLTHDGLASAAQKLATLHSDLGAMVAQDGNPPMWGRRPGFATLIQIILEQQVSLASGSAAYRKLSAGLGRVTPHRMLDRSQLQIRRMGLTRQKARYCHELAKAIVDRKLNLAMLNHARPERVRQELMGITGIGLWTSDIYLLMALKHPDIWPRGDLALYQVMRGLRKRNDPPEKLDILASRWRPWRSVAARILWHHYLCTRRRGS